ncbi:DUF4055 domain-containing protein [Advenella sp. FME57]|uniref:DUF4055 domain-containing protein n=1 Tax=Advenella sp. FME57 TaxID=2742604 RepID=UPI001866476B|nr:DUF4055 domain-containing protein [Advenella sp. FME57]
MPVTTKHPDYLAHEAEWKLMDDALDGESAIKKCGTTYLPKPAGMAEAEKLDSGNVRLYNNYRDRAQYEHWVKDGVRAMMGLVSRLTPEIVLPAGMEDMRDNATDDGFGLVDLFQRIVRQSIGYGRVPIVVNVDDLGRPFVSIYKARSGTNWKEGNQGGRRDLELAVLLEARPKDPGDKYSHETVTVYRVFEMVDGKCVTRVLDEKDQVIEEERTLSVADSNRKFLSYVPVIFHGSTNNSADVDEVPLLSMARATLKSYQLSADYYTALHYTSHPQPWVSGLDENTELKMTGPSAAWDLGREGHCGYLEFQGAGIAAVRSAMQDQKNVALEAGARVMDVSGVESGEARQTRQNDQHATLHSIVKSAAAAIEQALRFAAEWTGRDPKKVQFVVKPDFNIPDLDPQVLGQLQQAVLAGGISWDTYWQYLTTGKLPEHNYDEEALKVENPGGVIHDKAQ